MSIMHTYHLMLCVSALPFSAEFLGPLTFSSLTITTVAGTLAANRIHVVGSDLI